MAGKASLKTNKPSKRTVRKNSNSSKGSTQSSQASKSKASARTAKTKKGKSLIKKKPPVKAAAKQPIELPKETTELSIAMESVRTIKGIIELPKRRRGRPTKEEEDLREKILKEHGITGDPRVKDQEADQEKINQTNHYFLAHQSLILVVKN